MFHENFHDNAVSWKIVLQIFFQPYVMQKRYLLGTLKSKRKLQMSYKKEGRSLTFTKKMLSWTTTILSVMFLGWTRKIHKIPKHYRLGMYVCLTTQMWTKPVSAPMLDELWRSSAAQMDRTPAHIGSTGHKQP